MPENAGPKIFTLLERKNSYKFPRQIARDFHTQAIIYCYLYEIVESVILTNYYCLSAVYVTSTLLTIVVANLQIGGQAGVAQGTDRFVVGSVSILSVGLMDFRGAELLCQGTDALFLSGDAGKMQSCVSMTIAHRGLFK